MARKNLSVITKQTGTPLEIAVIPRRLGTPVIVPPNQLTINYLRNLYDVSIVNVVDMQVLQYESGSSYWVNTSPVDAHTYFYTKDQVDALIVDVSGAIIAGNFIKESSLGTDFVWNAGLLDVSIVTMDYAYVNASLNALSNSVAATYATNASVNTALTEYVPNTGGAFNGDVSITGANIITGLNGNVRLGGNSMAANSGSNNVAIGPNALGNLTMGNLNVAIGWNAGADAAHPHGTFTDGSSNVYIGANSTPSSDSVVNEMALGMGSRGRGSNTVAIGNVNTIATYLEGSLYVDLELWERGYSRAYIDGSINAVYASISATNASLAAYSTTLIELDDVSIVSLTDKQGILYDSSDAVWKNTDTIDIDDYIYSKAQIDASFATIAYVDSKAVDSYGGYYVQDNSIALVIPTGTTYTTVQSIWNKTGAVHQKDVSVDTSVGSITINEIGKYHVNGSFSFSCGTNNVIWRGTAFYDGVEKGWIHWKAKTGTLGDAVNASFTGILDVSIIGKALDFRIRHDQGGDVNWTLEYGNVNIFKIG